MSINRDHLCVGSDTLSNNRLDSVHSSLSYQHGRHSLTQFGLTTGIQPYQSANPAMSAAAAAAFLIQAAAGGSANDPIGNSPHSVRRCSTSSLIESPQPSPLMISAAAQQALAVAHAIASPNSPVEVSGASSFQAVVLSLALAASSTCSTTSSSSFPLRDYQRSFCGNSAMNDLISLSEQHPDLLTVHSTLASVFRRRSSTFAPPNFSQVFNPNCIESGLLNEIKAPQSTNVDSGNSQYEDNRVF